jgi:DNA-binding SARP family transcriptional activator
MGHVLHCRLILAVAVLKSGDFAQAIEHLSALSDHIVRTQPILALATYVTVFPNLLGALALAVGVDDLPDRLFDLLTGARGALAVHQAAVVLSPAEQEVLCSRMRAVNPTDSDAVQEPEAICRVRLFGGLEVVTPRGQVGERDWSKRKARLLFAMLVSRMGTDVPRGEIIEYLWPDMQEERALNNFYVVWSAMKRAISPESIRDTPCPYVEHVRGVCRIVKQHVISDLEEFSDLVSIARQARHDGDVEGELAALRALADVYRGEVLPGDVYDDWFAPLRDRFRHDFEDAMLRASTILEEQGDPHGGLQLLRRAMAADPWREDLYQAQLRMQIAAGQRSAAIETYMLCRSRLTADLGIDPSRETTALYERVLGMEEPEGLSRV